MSVNCETKVTVAQQEILKVNGADVYLDSDGATKKVVHKAAAFANATKKVQDMDDELTANQVMMAKLASQRGT